MNSDFPVIGVMGEYALVDLFGQPADSLGVGLVKFVTKDEPSISSCSVISAIGSSAGSSQVKSLEKSGKVLRPSSSVIEQVITRNAQYFAETEPELSVLVARSPHGQAAAWATTEEINGRLLITPSPSLNSRQIASAQDMALRIAKEISLVGVMEVEIVLTNDQISPGRLRLGPTMRGVWTIEGARTSQFEQHIRAILDLPLGDPSACQPFAITGAYRGSSNMYRPYLHLMARSPGLKFHQYAKPARAGHVTALGKHLLDLQECVLHAVEYMSGEIDE